MACTPDTQLKPFDLGVEVRDRSADPTGTRPSAEEKALAERLAQSIVGSERVESRILLDRAVPHNQARHRAETAIGDAGIAAMVRAQLL